MSYKKKLLPLLITLLFSTLLYSIDFDNIDQLNHDGKYEESLKILKDSFNEKAPDSAIIWRISRELFEIADNLPNKKKDEKLSKFDEAMAITKKYIDITTGDKRDRAQIPYWYAANLGSKGEVIGIKESLNIIPELFAMADKSLEIDPSFADAYFLKAKIDSAVPGFLYPLMSSAGDKFRMAINLNKAIKNDPESLTILVDSASSFYKRNWDIDKKNKYAEKNNTKDGTPEDKTDREYALDLCEKAVKSYKALSDPSARDKKKYNEALKLIKDLK